MHVVVYLIDFKECFVLSIYISLNDFHCHFCGIRNFSSIDQNGISENVAGGSILLKITMRFAKLYFQTTGSFQKKSNSQFGDILKTPTVALGDL